MRALYSALLKTWSKTSALVNREEYDSKDDVAEVVQPEKGMMSRRPALSKYQRLTHKPWASYGHALGLLDWQLISGMTVWEPQSNLGAGITVRLLYKDY